MKNLIVVLIAVAAVGGLAFFAMSGSTSDAPPITTWDEGAIEETDELVEAESAESADEREEFGSRSEIDGGQLTPGSTIALSIRGRVIDSAQRAVASATVRLEVRSMSRRNRRADRVRQSVTTGADGRFEFQGPGPSGSRVQLLVQHDRYAPLLSSHTVQENGDLDVGDLVTLLGATISGRVTDEAGTPIGDAEVKLDPSDGNPLAWSPLRSELLQPVRTDGAGLYRAEMVMPGNYRISASARGMQRGQLRTPLRATDGEVAELDVIVLKQGAVLTGTVYGPDGAPVERADVRAGGSRSRDRVRTNAKGRFEFEHLARTEIELEVEADGFLTWRQESIDVERTQDVVVRLEPGLAIRGQAIDVRGGGPVEAYAAKLDRIRGLDRDGSSARQLDEIRSRLNTPGIDAAARAQLEMRLADAERRNLDRNRRRDAERRFRSRRNRSLASLGAVEPRENGEFEFAGLDEGIYVVYVGSPDHQIAQTGEIEVRRDTAPQPVVVELQRGIMLTGVVTSSRRGAVANARLELCEVRPPRPGGRNAFGPPSQSSRFGAMFREAGPQGDRVMEVRSDERGTFEFRHAPAGEYFVRAYADGFANYKSDAFALQQDQDGFAIELAGTATLRGRVSGVPAEQLNDTRIVAFSGWGRGRMRNGRPDANGSYSFDDLQPGNYLVRAFIGNLRTFVSSEMQKIDSGEVEYDLIVESGEDYELDLVVDLPEVGQVNGTVTRNGEPARNRRVNLRQKTPDGNSNPSMRFSTGRFSRRLSARTDQNGRFEIQEVPAGEYEVRVYGTGRNARDVVFSTDVVVVAERTEEVALHMTVSRLSGTVSAADGTASADLQGDLYVLPGATARPASLRDYERENRSHRLRIRDGAFELDDVTVGPALLVLRVQGRNEVVQQGVVQAGESQLTLQVGAK